MSQEEKEMHQILRIMALRGNRAAIRFFIEESKKRGDPEDLDAKILLPHEISQILHLASTRYPEQWYNGASGIDIDLLTFEVMTETLKEGRVVAYDPKTTWPPNFDPFAHREAVYQKLWDYARRVLN